jgi:predicted amidophosphoribosyltransferase
MMTTKTDVRVCPYCGTKMKSQYRMCFGCFRKREKVYEDCRAAGKSEEWSRTRVNEVYPEKFVK